MPIPSDDNFDPLHHDIDSQLGQLNHTFNDSLLKLSSHVTSIESTMTQTKQVIYQCMDSVHKSLSYHIQAMNDSMDKTISSHLQSLHGSLQKSLDKTIQSSLGAMKAEMAQQFDTFVQAYTPESE